jgi:hypothetical protein
VAHVLEQRVERRAVVDRFPHATVGGGDVVERWIRLEHGEVGDTARHRRRANLPEMQRIERAATGDRRRLLASAKERGARERDGKRHTGNQ